MIYSKYGKADLKNVDGGYKNTIWYANIEDFLMLKKPEPGEDPVPGATLRITSAHTFEEPDGFVSLLSKKHSVTTKGETIGDEGAQSMKWTFETVILGDGAILQEQLEATLNEDNVWMVKDQDCVNGTGYVQFGDDCLSPTIKLEFTGNTTAEGYKEYKLTGTIKKHKYFYESTLTEKAA